MAQMALRRCSVISCVAARRRGAARELCARWAGVQPASAKQAQECFFAPPRRLRRSGRGVARAGAARTHVEGAAVVLRHNAAAVIRLLQRLRRAGIVAQPARLERAAVVGHHGAQRRRQRRLLHGARAGVQQLLRRRARRRSRGWRLGPPARRHRSHRARPPHAPAAAAAGRAAQRLGRRRRRGAARGRGSNTERGRLAPSARAALAAAAGRRRAGRRSVHRGQQRYTPQRAWRASAFPIEPRGMAFPRRRAARGALLVLPTTET